MEADNFAIVEIMGHQRIAGKVREVTRAGVQMLEVEVPAMDGRPSYVRRFSGAAIFSETPVPEAAAIEFLRRERWSIANPLLLGAAPAGEQPPDAEVVSGDHSGVCVDCDRVKCICNDEVLDDNGEPAF